jgi:hypothetical protein
LLLLWPSNGLAQGFSQTIFTQGGIGSPGLFTSLLEPTHVVTVRALTSSKTAFTIRFSREGRPESTISQSSSAETLESHFVSYLKAGRSYRYPQVVLEFLGKDTTVRLARSVPGRPLESLTAEKPFRAVVLDQGISETHYSIILQEAGGSLRHLQGAFETDRIRKQAMWLSGGRSFEFPAALEDALLTKEQREERSRPKNEATTALYRYLGEWRGGIEGNPNAKIEMACHTRPDGSGIWREITFTDGTEELPPLPDIYLVEYDPSEQAYLAGSLKEGSPPPMRSTWDEAARTYTTMLPADDQGIKRVNTATFTREDRIDWRTTMQDKHGKVTTSSAGYYDRVRLPDDGSSDPRQPSHYAMGGASSFATSSNWHHEIAVSQLGACEPFRGEIASICLRDNSIEIEFRKPNGGTHRQVDVRDGIGKSDLAKALAYLKKGGVYEFPYCIKNPGKQPLGKPATPEMKSLEPFIGTWKSFRKEPDGTYKALGLTARFFWSADGTSLWRENTYQPVNPVTGKPDGGPDKKHLDRILYDSLVDCYVEVEEHAVPSAEERPARWDAAKKAYHWSSAATKLHPRKTEGVRRFVSADRIEYEVRHLSEQGSTASEDFGYYERIKE